MKFSQLFWNTEHQDTEVSSEQIRAQQSVSSGVKSILTLCLE